MTARVYTRYGGRKGRYKEGPTGLVGVFDPWQKRSVEFRNDEVLKLWLLRRSEIQVRSIELRPRLLQWVHNGARRSCMPDMVTWRASGQTIEVALRGNALSQERRRRDLIEAANAHDLAWHETTPGELMASAERIANMAHVRQVLTLWHDDPLTDLLAWLPMSLARDGDGTRAEIRARLVRRYGHLFLPALDAAIFRLYFAGALWIDLDRRFEDECPVIGR